MKLSPAAVLLPIFLVSSCGDREPASPSYDPRVLVEGQRGTAIVNIPGLPPQEVEWVVVGGVPVHSGDIVVSPEEMSGLSDPRTTTAGRRFEQFRWPSGVIPFEIDPVSIHPTVQQNIRDAIAEWDNQTVLTFTPHTPGSGGDYLSFVVDPTAGGPFQGRSETIGRFAGRGAHVVHLGGQGTKLTALHEIGHVIGLYHEQQRADRNNYIRVYDGTNGRANRIPAGYEDNYRRYVNVPLGVFGNDGIDLPPSPIDFNSIMMYSSDSFNPSCNPNPCMDRLDGTTWPLPTTLSPQDIDGVNRLYLAPLTAGTIDTSLTPARNIVLTSSGGARIDALAIRSYDNHLLHEFHDDGGWHNPPEDWGAVQTTNDQFSAVSWSTNRFDWATITSGSSPVNHTWRIGTSVFSEVFPATTPYAVALASQGVDRLDLFVIMQNRQIYWKTKTISGWNTCTSNCFQGWTLIGNQGPGTATFTAPMSAVSWGPGRIDVMATTTSGTIRRFWYANGVWNGPETFVNAATRNVSIASWGVGRLDVFYYLNNMELYRRSYEGNWGPSMFLSTETDAKLSAVGHRLPNENRVSYTSHFLSGGNDIWFTTTLAR